MNKIKRNRQFHRYNVFFESFARCVRGGHSRFHEKLGLEKQLCQTNPFQGCLEGGRKVLSPMRSYKADDPRVICIQFTCNWLYLSLALRSFFLAERQEATSQNKEDSSIHVNCFTGQEDPSTRDKTRQKWRRVVQLVNMTMIADSFVQRYHELMNSQLLLKGSY